VVVCDIDPLVTEVTQRFMPFMWRLTTREVEDRLRILGLDHDPFFSAEVYRAMFALPPLIGAQLGTDVAVNPVARF
jgi:hypothetical protein